MKKLLLPLLFLASTFCCAQESPAFQWRGCMIDVSRHYFPMSFLEKQVDVLAGMGINRLHLHLVDAAGWRMEIKAYPSLTTNTAWRTESDWDKWWVGEDRRYCSQDAPGAYGGYYTQEELRKLVGYAALKGITIVPEIEMPGHSEEVIAAMPQLNCQPEKHVKLTPKGKAVGGHVGTMKNTGDVCPGNEAVYEFFQNVLLEVMDVFPSEYIHIGGDEAGKANWDSCARCKELKRKLGTSDKEALQAYLIRRMTRWLNQQGRKVIAWDEVVEGLKNKAVDIPVSSDRLAIMLWRNPATAREAIGMGHDVIMAPSAYCYLDYYQDAPQTQPRAIGGFLPLSRVYAFDPYEEMTPEEQKHVLGVQGNLWTEYIETPEHAEYMLYPRMLAIAEIGKLGANRPSWDTFRKQALKTLKRLRKQGVNAFDLAHEEGPRPESRQPVEHKAVGAKVLYNKPYSPHYVAAGETTLTDGLRGDYSHGDGRWQGFVTGDCLDVVVDLGQLTDIKEVSLDFMQNSGAWIYLPASLLISASADGENYLTLVEETTARKTNVGTEFRRYSWHGKLSDIRYVRVQGTATGEGEWLFTDEIIVR